MLDFHRLTLDHFVALLRGTYAETYGDINAECGNIIGWVGRLALENIARSDALYHDAEHTMLVALCGQEILRGKHLVDGGVHPRDWLHFMVALLCHDIGYLRGVCHGDGGGRYATGCGDATIELPPGATDAALTPYHVDRGQQFVRERFGHYSLSKLDVEQVNRCIEATRFGPPAAVSHDSRDYPALACAADFIGQLGDPAYLRKIPALFYEFQELGLNARFGYNHPGDMREGYAHFFWKQVSPQIQGGLHYLGVTHAGRQWIANLHAHVFAVEHDGRL